MYDGNLSDSSSSGDESGGGLPASTPSGLPPTTLCLANGLCGDFARQSPNDIRTLFAGAVSQLAETLEYSLLTGVTVPQSLVISSREWGNELGSLSLENRVLVMLACPRENLRQLAQVPEKAKARRVQGTILVLCTDEISDMELQKLEVAYDLVFISTQDAALRTRLTARTPSTFCWEDALASAA